MGMRLCKPAAAMLLFVPVVPWTAGAQAPQGRQTTPWAVVASKTTHTFYAVDTTANEVAEVDAKTQATHRIRVGTEPIALALDEGAHRLYVVNAGSGDVSVVDTATRRVIDTPKTDRHPYAIAVDSATHQVYVSNTFSNELTHIDGKTGAVERLPLGSKDALLCDPLRGRVYMASYEDRSLSVLEERSGKVEHLPAEMHLWSMALEAATGDVYVTSIGAGKLLRVRAGHAAEAIGTGQFPAAAALDGSTVVIANYGDGTLSLVDGLTRRTVRVSPSPQAVAVDTERHLAYVADAHSSTVTTVDVSRGRVVEERAAGEHPYAVAVEPFTGNVLVANLPTRGGPAYTLLPGTKLPR